VTDKPLIGISAKCGDLEWVAKHVQDYLDAITRAGSAIRVLAPRLVPAQLPQSAKEIQGLLLTGGGDVHPRRYGQSISGTRQESIDEDRDELELTLAELALADTLPVLAICRGMQVLNIAMGGQLLQHIDGHRSQDDSDVCKHQVRLVPETSLWNLFGHQDELQVNSHHHQAITRQELAPGLAATAHSLPDTDIVEAVESTLHTWVVGVQWHPERTNEVTSEQQNLFTEFVSQAANSRR